MFEEEFDFLMQLAECPDDESRRLVYADWLEEQGDGRAEFLRLEIELQEHYRGRTASKLADRLASLSSQLDKVRAAEGADSVTRDKLVDWERKVTFGRASELFLHSRRDRKKTKRSRKSKRR